MFSNDDIYRDNTFENNGARSCGNVFQKNKMVRQYLKEKLGYRLIWSVDWKK